MVPSPVWLPTSSPVWYSSNWNGQAAQWPPLLLAQLLSYLDRALTITFTSNKSTNTAIFVSWQYLSIWIWHGNLTPSNKNIKQGWRADNLSTSSLLTLLAGVLLRSSRAQSAYCSGQSLQQVLKICEIICGRHSKQFLVVLAFLKIWISSRCRCRVGFLFLSLGQ